MTDIRTLLAVNLKKYRKIKGWTQEKIAEEAKTSIGYIATLETGRKFPSAEMLTRLAAALDIDTPDFFSTKEIHYLPQERKTIVSLYQDILDEIENVIHAKIKRLA